MMNIALKQKFLDEAVRIGEALLSQAEHRPDGVTWQTMGSDGHARVIWHEAEDIYRGVSGIVLFLLALYRQTGDERYLHTAQEAMHRASNRCRRDESSNNSFYFGRLSVAYTLLQLYQVTGESGYLEQALVLAQSDSTLPALMKPVDDLITGTAGTLLGLLHLHAASGKAGLLSAIDKLANHLIEAAYPGPQGVYWDRSHNQIRGLCGLSHGAAGIGFVFLELGHYCQNNIYYHMAEEAFRYENYHFDKMQGNWPDYRKWLSEDKYFIQGIMAYLDGDEMLLTEGKDVNFWCHGAAGIGLSRLRALELLQKPLYQQEALAALQKTMHISGLADDQSDGQTVAFCLCHGDAGNAELFLEAYRVLGDTHYWTLAQKIGLNLLHHRQNGGHYISGYAQLQGAGDQEDTGLFMGNAGIGYFFLRLLDPLNVPSILAPRLGNVGHVDCGHHDPSLFGQPVITISRRILAKTFNRTLAILEQAAPKQVAAWFADHTIEDNKSGFINFVTSLLPSLPPDKQNVVADVFSLEQKKMRLDEGIPSYALLHVEENIQSARAARIFDQGVHLSPATYLQLNPRAEILTTCWQWDTESPDQWGANLTQPPHMHYVLLQPKVDGVSEVWLYPLAYHILTLFGNKMNVVEVTTALAHEMQLALPPENKTYDDVIEQQIQQLLAASILIWAR